MSSLLEQAIVDATALKEAAMKTAEKKIVDKYSHKIKEAVDKLLEQDESEFDAADSLENATDEDNIPSDLNSDNDFSQEQEKSPLDKIKSAFMSDGSDDELITIDFSSLKAKPIQAAPPVAPVGPAPVSATSVAPQPAAPAAAPASVPIQEGLNSYEDDEVDLSEESDIELDEEIEEEVELDEELSSSDMIVLTDPKADIKAKTSDVKCEGSGCIDEEISISLEDEIEEDATYGADEASPENLGGTLYEEDVQEEEFELEESLVVDMQGKSDGYRGLTDNERRELEDVELAKRQDEEYQLKMREFSEALDASENKVKKAQKREKALVKENEELKNTLMSLKEHIEKMNVSNAKLLYMNRALGNNSLNERQKQQIVETLSKADSVEGAKIAYETLQGSVQSVVKENKAPKSLNEAVSRSNSPFLVRPRNNSVDPYAERMKTLAGIKN